MQKKVQDKDQQSREAAVERQKGAVCFTFLSFRLAWDRYSWVNPRAVDAARVVREGTNHFCIGVALRI